MRGLGQWSERYVVIDEHDLLLTTTQLIPQAAQEQERTKCQCAIFQTILNLQFPELASPTPTIATLLNAKPPTPLYFYPLYVKSHQDEQKKILPLEKTMVQLHSVSPRDIQPSIPTSALA